MRYLVIIRILHFALAQSTILSRRTSETPGPSNADRPPMPRNWQELYDKYKSAPGPPPWEEHVAPDDEFNQRWNPVEFRNKERQAVIDKLPSELRAPHQAILDKDIEKVNRESSINDHQFMAVRLRPLPRTRPEIREQRKNDPGRAVLAGLSNSNAGKDICAKVQARHKAANTYDKSENACALEVQDNLKKLEAGGPSIWPPPEWGESQAGKDRLAYRRAGKRLDVAMADVRRARDRRVNTNLALVHGIMAGKASSGPEHKALANFHAQKATMNIHGPYLGSTRESGKDALRRESMINTLKTESRKKRIAG